MFEIHKVEKEIAGKKLSIETGLLANQADGAVTVTYGETVVFASACSTDAKEDADYFPLMVDYRERQVAAGKFPGGFMKREGRPSSREMLIARCVDRPIRPLFPEGYFDEVQIMVNVLSADQENDPDVLAIIAASAALTISTIPFQGPLGACKVGMLEGKLTAFPTVSQMQNSDLDLMLGGRENNLNMIEVEADEISEEKMAEAVKFGQSINGEICRMINELQKKCGKEKICSLREENADVEAKIREYAADKIAEAKKIEGKQDRQEALDKIQEELNAQLCEGEEPVSTEMEVNSLLDKLEKEVTRKMILDGARPDGRDYDTIRDLDCRVGVIPRVHGSSLFTRGETQALISVILGTGKDEQIVDGVHEEFGQRFMLHYNFPPYSVGEVRFIRGPGRREIGHGALAEKSLRAVIPSEDQFPYTIKVVSDITGSNGSSSMASICGGSLALMDSGVPIKKPVAGISVGMVSDEDKYQLITDILGEEDHFGDMDFKVAGTTEGITGIQLDLKKHELPHEILVETLERARKARLKILESMRATISEARPELSKYAPKLTSIQVDPEVIGKIIGPGGATIKAIQERTNTNVEIDDSGKVTISTTEGDGQIEAERLIKAITEKPKIGSIFKDAVVVSIKEFGVFVEIAPGVEGLCHISELSDGFVKNAKDICKIGDIMPVKLTEIDRQGRLKFSRKQAVAEVEGESKEE
ncbi:Polyribonucleotide nucleotidyltransferase [Sedimentisphaera cyanobacteriorum]|uniref:Polyribonucleotide nucleotidyltransferase n=1 Tax=Sedimentisphaera cyanobacteriorum TaxID=1940790 RepID=A0A1Q2HNM1_9BACT|nr:polyribonucleotide nucleotidyltransferase [Sedimentisphaera cyanobacteriorum]AQQ09047.1 Polyribonucleotide nucleotidyltransferase [Sedimentisphaera cyanobacteriorum]